MILTSAVLSHIGMTNRDAWFICLITSVTYPLEMEIASSYCHLGKIICSSLSDEQDILRRRIAFIGQVNSVLCFLRKFLSAA